MTQTIRLEAVLRETVRTPYCDLVTRSTGRAVRSSIQQALEAQPTAVTLLDFSEVGLVDFSCADEVVAKLLLALPDGTTVVLQGLREEQLEAIEHVLAHHDLAALVRDPASGAARMVGRVNPDLHAAFLALQREGPATPEGLARRTGWPEDQTEAALRALLRLRLVRCAGARYIAPLSDDALAWP
jgi:hypothetical protein